MLLITLNINGTSHYVSTTHEALTHQWERRVISLDPPRRACSAIYGGFQRMMFGSLKLSVETFDDAGNWPPPKTLDVDIAYSASTEAAKETIFSGNAHLDNIGKEGVVYLLSNTTYDILLLDEIEDYDGNITPEPRAFGVIVHQRPLRLPDVGTRHCYSLAYIDTTADWYVYDDGVDISSNVINLDTANNRFELDSVPVGEVTISGTGEYETLSDCADFIQERLSLSSATITPELADSNIVSCWADSQITAIDFLDKLFAAFGFTFRIDDSDIVGGPLFGSTAGVPSSIISTTYHFPIQISWPIPTVRGSAKWNTRTAVEETKGKYIRDTEEHLEIVGTVLSAGTATGTTGVDAAYGGWMISSGVKAGMMAHRIDDASSSTLSGDPTSETSAPLTSGIFESGTAHPYYINDDNLNGLSLELQNVYSEDRATIEFNLAKALARSNMAKIVVKFPIGEESIPTIGSKQYIINQELPQDSPDYSIHVLIPTEIAYDLIENMIIVTGLGGLYFSEVPS